MEKTPVEMILVVGSPGQLVDCIGRIPDGQGQQGSHLQL